MKTNTKSWLRFCTISIGLVSALAPTSSYGGLVGTLAPTLWYREAAQKWTEALPIGNGRLGGMVFGDVTNERVQFNEDTLWTGQPHEYQNEGAAQFLPQLRRLLWDGKQKEAEDLAMREFMSEPVRQKAYQAFGDLRLLFPTLSEATNYRRELDLDTAVAKVTFKAGGVTYTREFFSSFPDQAIVCRLSADKPGNVSFLAKLDSPHTGARSMARDDRELVLTGQVEEGGVRFESRIAVIPQGGRVETRDEGISVQHADSALVLLVAATSVKNYRDISADPAKRCAKTLRSVSRKKFEPLLKAHVADHQSLFRRVQLDLGTSAAANLPTDQRLKQVASTADPELAALYFQFGRYLLIASSRPGAQPANLQGIWNDSLKPPWDSKWTVNINTEMNYWPAEICNLSECHLPLFDLIRECAETGAKTAQAHYGAPGWVLHHNTDLWRGTAPINASNHGIWPTGGAWLCQHLWEHYLFSGDKAFLRKAYPLMKEASLFFTHYLVPDPGTGWLISGPSNSPENGGLVMGPTMDHQIIRELFANTAAAAKIVGRDEEFAEKLAQMSARIAPNQVGRHGQLQEWLEDKDNPKNDHRHVSHLWGLYPGHEISPRYTPHLCQAAKQSLIFRGDGGTGWSKAWKINFWARFLDGDHAHKMLIEALAGNTFPNLFDAHPPFQIDGNFGGTAGIAEMLLQSQHVEPGTGDPQAAGGYRVIELLAALPSAWPDGSVKGLRARDGFELDFSWQGGQLTAVTLRSLLGKPCKLVHADRVTQMTTKKGGTYGFNGALQPL